MTTIEEAKKFLLENFEKGCKCPICGQFVKKYKRKITSSMALALIILYKEGPGFHHWGNLIDDKGYSNVVNSGDKSKLVYWGLVEKNHRVREDNSNRNGFYKLTDKGKDFVEGSVAVNLNAYLYNNKFLGFGGPEVYIKECLGNKFVYSDLMGDFMENVSGKVESQKPIQEAFV